MALGDSYATTAEIKTRLDLSVATYDTQLGEALSTASRGIEKFCGRQFNKTTTAGARVYRPAHRCLVKPDDFHTITDLVIKTDEDGDAVYEATWVAADYELRPLNGIVDGESGWPFYEIHAVLNRVFPTRILRAAVQVTAQWGWTAVPAPVKETCLMVAEEVFKMREAPFGVAGFGDLGVVRVRSNPKAVEMLAPYRRTPVLVG